MTERESTRGTRELWAISVFQTQREHNRRVQDFLGYWTYELPIREMVSADIQHDGLGMALQECTKREINEAFEDGEVSKDIFENRWIK